MSGPQFKPWSDDPYAPKIPRIVYFLEKVNFVGTFIGSIFYGMLIVLFFKCMTTLFSPSYRKGEGVKWRLVSYTAVMFSLVTVLVAMSLDIQSTSYIDNRGFSGVEGELAPGPLGYQQAVYFKAINAIPNTVVAFVLNNWLADGFLLYRCYVVYSKNLWIIAFPCLMYLASVAMGILMIHPARGPSAAGSVWSSLPYLSISLSLNIILTLMIVARLVLHARVIRTITGSPTVTSGLYTAIAIMLIGSSAIYAVSSLSIIAPMTVGSPIMDVSLVILAETQVIAPLLVVQRDELQHSPV